MLLWELLTFFYIQNLQNKFSIHCKDIHYVKCDTIITQFMKWIYVITGKNLLWFHYSANITKTYTAQVYLFVLRSRWKGESVVARLT